MFARCTDCQREYETTDVKDYGLCPRCQRLDDAIYANDLSPVPDLSAIGPAWTWSKSAQLERLGITGEVDE